MIKRQDLASRFGSNGVLITDFKVVVPDEVIYSQFHENLFSYYDFFLPNLDFTHDNEMIMMSHALGHLFGEPGLSVDGEVLRYRFRNLDAKLLKDKMVPFQARLLKMRKCSLKSMALDALKNEQLKPQIPVTQSVQEKPKVFTSTFRLGPKEEEVKKEVEFLRRPASPVFRKPVVLNLPTRPKIFTSSFVIGVQEVKKRGVYEVVYAPPLRPVISALKGSPIVVIARVCEDQKGVARSEAQLVSQLPVERKEFSDEKIILGSGRTNYAADGCCVRVKKRFKFKKRGFFIIKRKKKRLKSWHDPVLFKFIHNRSKRKRRKLFASEAKGVFHLNRASNCCPRAVVCQPTHIIPDYGIT